jgi:hypothetical protein
VADSREGQAVTTDPTVTPQDIPCRECGHSDRMHVKGSSPRYTGCMTRLGITKKRRCPCNLTPAEAREAKP